VHQVFVWKLRVVGVSIRAPARGRMPAADKAATDDQRSLTSLVEKLLSDYLKKKGYLE
jgi:hypothetical protein